MIIIQKVGMCYSERSKESHEHLNTMILRLCSECQIIRFVLNG